MTQIVATYPIARYGLATNFTESEVPVTFALKFRNRFINAAGGAEKRPGMTKLGNQIPGEPTLTGLHELVGADGTSTIFASSSNGTLYKLVSSTWTQVYSGVTSGTVLRSVQMGKKLIFFNGTDPNFATEDGTTFKQLLPIVVRGLAAGAVSAGGIDDADVSDWANLTDVATNDLVRNITKNAYGLITAVTTANCTHTSISSAATGLGQSAIGNQESGDRYEIIDLVENNVIPTDGEPDNIALAGPGTGVTTVGVSGVNFLTKDVRSGDYVSNTTRSAIALVSTVATALTVTSVAGQTAGDSLVFLKSAMPITKNAHVHFGRGYFLDARDQRLIRITGIDNPEDLTTDAGTVDANTFQFADLQPHGDIVKDMGSFQRFFVVGGKNNIFLYQGTNPIADTSANISDFTIIGLFPQGVVSPDSIVSIGNDLVFITPDGVQTAQMIRDSTHLGRSNISEAIKNVLRGEIQNAAEADVQIIHYPRRAWLMVKVSTKFYIFNYTSFLGDQQIIDGAPESLDRQRGSWSIFDGKFAQQNCYFVRSNGDLLCGGSNGLVYKFDAGTYNDDGEAYKTEYQTGWLSLSEPRKNVNIKDVKYIKPILDAGGTITYTISIEGDFEVNSSETITVPVSGGGKTIGLATIPFVIGGSSLQNKKYSIRSRGERHRLTISTEDIKGPDVVSQFTIYGNKFGIR